MLDPSRHTECFPSLPLPVGVVLAGGQGQRMGGVNKGWITWQGRPLVERVIERMQPQVASLVISANTDIDRYRALGFPCVMDPYPDYRGPLAGITAAFAACPGQPLLCMPVDAPRAPADLGQRLARALEASAAPAAIAHDGDRLQPLFALLRPVLADRLRTDLDMGSLAAGRWFHEQGAKVVDFSDQPQAFVNLNTPGDLADLTRGT